MKPYQPSQIVPARGALLLLAVVLLGGIAIGALFAWLSSVLYIILVFPILMGALGGWLTAFSVRSGKIRNPRVAFIGGLLMGLVIAASYWITQYLRFAVVTLHQYDFIEYVQMAVMKGVPVLHAGELYLLTLGPVLTWIYSVLEILLILWLSSRPGQAQARQPFCETCRRWYPRPALLGTLGSSRTKEVLGLIEGSQFQKLGEELQSNPALPNVGVYLATCGDGCANGDAFLTASQQTRNSKGGVVSKDLLKGLISPFQLQDLRRGIEARRALYGLEPSTPPQ